MVWAMKIKKPSLGGLGFVVVLGLKVFKECPYSKSNCNWRNDVLANGLNEFYCHVFYPSLAQAAVMAAVTDS